MNSADWIRKHVVARPVVITPDEVHCAFCPLNPGERALIDQAMRDHADLLAIGPNQLSGRISMKSFADLIKARKGGSLSAEKTARLMNEVHLRIESFLVGVPEIQKIYRNDHVVFHFLKGDSVRGVIDDISPLQGLQSGHQIKILAQLNPAIPQSTYPMVVTSHQGRISVTDYAQEYLNPDTDHLDRPDLPFREGRRLHP